jgi:hypothetical protein
MFCEDNGCPGSLLPGIFFVTNGINYIDLNVDGVKDMVVSGYRGNITAHSFDYYTFYINDRKYDPDLAWNIVEIEGENKERAESKNYEICTFQGADAILRDIEFVKGNDGKLQLVLADREFGKSFIDIEKVTLTFYTLEYNGAEMRYIYKVKSKSISKKNIWLLEMLLSVNWNKSACNLLQTIPCLVLGKDEGGWTPLLSAVPSLTISIMGPALEMSVAIKDVADLLIAKGADVNARDNDGATPFGRAAARYYKDLVELLRQHGGHE